MSDMLVQRAKAGDQEAFAQLMEQYQRPIYNLTLRMCGRPEDAEELTQTAFFHAWRGLPDFAEEASFFTWLYRLATNASIDFLRREARRFSLRNTLPLHGEDGSPMDLPDTRQLPESSALEADRRAVLDAGFAALKEEQRDILLMRELEGLSYQEIADLLSLELGTVKSRIARARLALRGILEENGNYFERETSKGKEKKEGVEAK